VKKVAVRFKNAPKKSLSPRENWLLGLKKWLSDQIPEEILHLAEEKNPVAEEKILMAEEKNPVAEQKNFMAEQKNSVAEEKKPMAEAKIPIAEQKFPTRKHFQTVA
jgi:hypothetical protein